MTRPSRFEGTIGRSLADSELWFDDPPHPGADAPNVVVILLDDLGFAHLGCYGSDSTRRTSTGSPPTVALHNFHVTAVCSPTRACLLTGVTTPRRHGDAAGHADRFPSVARDTIGVHAACSPQVLREQGYATFCVGKWHLAPRQRFAGPYDQWPRPGLRPLLRLPQRRDQPVHPEPGPRQPPDRPARRARRRVPTSPRTSSSRPLEDGRRTARASPRPALPRSTSPSVPPTRRTRRHPVTWRSTAAATDEGWDVVRERWHRRQQELGVIPDGTELAPAIPASAPGTTLSENQRRGWRGRLQEAFAAFLDDTDDQIGRASSTAAPPRSARQHRS